MQGRLWHRVKDNHFVKFGLPFLTFMILAPFGLKEFQTIRYRVKDRRQSTLSGEEALQFKRKKGAKFDLEEELKKTKEKLDIGNWENKRISRPWEEE